MNDLQFAWRYQCLPIRCSGRLISLRNEHSLKGEDNVKIDLEDRGGYVSVGWIHLTDLWVGGWSMMKHRVSEKAGNL
jgi:hypothetical protein